MYRKQRIKIQITFVYRKQRIKQWDHFCVQKTKNKNSDHFCVQKAKNKTLRSLLCTESKAKKKKLSKKKKKKKNQITVVYTKQRIKNSDHCWCGVTVGLLTRARSPTTHAWMSLVTNYAVIFTKANDFRIIDFRIYSMSVEWSVFVFCFGPTCCPPSGSIAWILTDRTPLRL